jgi:hypothetical protein
VLIHNDESFGQFSIFKRDALQSIRGALTFVQDTGHAAMPEAFEIDTLDVFPRYVQPSQQFTGLE